MKANAILVMAVSVIISIGVFSLIFKKFNFPKFLRKKLNIESDAKLSMVYFVTFMITYAIILKLGRHFLNKHFMCQIFQGITLGLFIMLMPDSPAYKYPCKKK